MLHFYSDSRLAFPRSDNTSLSRIALMFTTLHSIAVVLAALPYCLILRNSVNRLLALMFTTLHSLMVLRVELLCCCVVLCNFVNGRFI